MTLTDKFTSLTTSLRRNSPTILTAFGVAGTVTTAVLAARAAHIAAERSADEEPLPEEPKEKVKVYFERNWAYYVPACSTGVVTVGCIIASQKASSRRVAAAQAAFVITERALADYREKVVELLGENKDQKIYDEVIQDRVTADGNKSTHIIVSDGEVLCREEFTGRYFTSDMQKLRKAVNDVNELLIARDYIYLDTLYDMLGLNYTTQSSQMGWRSERLLGFEFSSAITEDGRPCLSFAYEYIEVL